MLRRLGTGVALSAALLVALPGCATVARTVAVQVAKSKAKPVPGATSVQPGENPADALAVAVASTSDESVKFIVGDGGDTYSGSYDANTRAAQFGADKDGQKVQITVTDKDLYLAGLTALKGSTMHFVVAKLPSSHPLVLLADPLANLALLTGATTVEWQSSGTLRGTIDLASVMAERDGTKKLVEALSLAASTLEFTAKVTPSGHIVDVTTTLPKVDKGTDVTFHLVVTQVYAWEEIHPPTDKVIEAPATAYQE